MSAPHPFLQRPHRTLLGLTVPVLLSLIAEPLTGAVDTAFVARLGAAPAAALGAGTALLSSTFWVFNFLGIGTQTEVARLRGAAAAAESGRAAGLALALGALIGGLLAIAAWPLAPALAAFMSGDDAVQAGTVSYLRLRLLGGPAVLIMMVGSHALRGMQDMRTPLVLAVAVNVLNVVLDPILIFGLGPAPALGLGGAALATTLSQWLGAGTTLYAVRARFGVPVPVRLGRRALPQARRLLVIGRDMVVRTGALLLFLLLATRVATRSGADAGAAHQGIRTIWMLTAFLLDAFAATAQSLVGYFVGAERRVVARRVAFIACGWAAGSGALLAVLLWAGQGAVAALLVPEVARPTFRGAFWIAAAALPLNALAFATDGIHWGTGDYAYLRNGMLASTLIGVLLLFRIDVSAPGALFQLWAVTAVWICVRSAWGMGRLVAPGAPLST